MSGLTAAEKAKLWNRWQPAEGTVNLNCLVAFSPSSTTSKSLIPGLSFRKFRPQNGRILLKLTVPA